MAKKTQRPTGVRLLVRLGRALHVHGMPVHRVELALNQLSEKFGLEGQFLGTPTSLIMSFGSVDEQRTHLVRVEPGAIDLSRLAALNSLIGRILEGELDARRAEIELDRINASKPPWSGAAEVASYGVTSGTAALLLGGDWEESVVATVIGLVIGLLSRPAAHSERLGNLYPAISALIASLLSGAGAMIFTDLYPSIPLLAGLVVLIPGLTLTLAMNELAHRHLVSGSARLIGGIVVFFQMGVGVVIGDRIQTELFGVPAMTPPEGLPFVGLLAILPVAAWGVMILFKARLRDFLPILIVSAITFVVSRWVGGRYDPEIGIGAGAAILGTSSHVIARLSGRPSSVTLIPAMLLIVPGSLGFRSFQALLGQDVLLGVESAFQMVLMAVALVTGLFLAHLLVPLKRPYG